MRASTETKPAPAQSPAQLELVPDTEFSITKVSYGSILMPVGLGLLTYGFGAFFQMLPGADLSSLMLIYGFPISVLGAALSYAQVRRAALSQAHSHVHASIALWKGAVGPFHCPSGVRSCILSVAPCRPLNAWLYLCSCCPAAHACALQDHQGSL